MPMENYLHLSQTLLLVRPISISGRQIAVSKQYLRMRNECGGTHDVVRNLYQAKPGEAGG